MFYRRPGEVRGKMPWFDKQTSIKSTIVDMGLLDWEMALKWGRYSGTTFIYLLALCTDCDYARCGPNSEHRNRFKPITDT
uniref:Uncharacterized protein n=1 Tax=Tanacetum cinerariifolium TaxID=118510 RepID=A0A699GJ56_TANCI|nr:hypothetical protein [Tanacetum cinerariifolium]